MKLSTKDFINTGTVLERALLHCFGGNEEAMDSLERNEDQSIKPFDVELKINGVEVDIVEFFEYYEKEYRNTVERTARSLFKDKINDNAGEITFRLQEIQDKVDAVADSITWDGKLRDEEES